MKPRENHERARHDRSHNECVSSEKNAKSPGISVREYYAGQALIGLLSGKYRDYDGLAHEETQIAIARLAYSIADAMFAKEASGAKDDEG